MQNTEEMLLQAVLGAQCEDGGWNLAGGQGDADMTGMALQALSFYYGKRTDVNAAVERGLAWISKNQLESGGFGTQGVETSESVAQYSCAALSGLGIDGSKDARFLKNGKSPLYGLFQETIFRKADLCMLRQMPETMAAVSAVCLTVWRRSKAFMRRLHTNVCWTDAVLFMICTI